jgi:hypothetical protein
LETEAVVGGNHQNGSQVEREELICRYHNTNRKCGNYKQNPDSNSTRVSFNAHTFGYIYTGYTQKNFAVSKVNKSLFLTAVTA